MISRWSLGSHKSTDTRITRGWWLRRPRRKKKKRKESHNCYNTMNGMNEKNWRRQTKWENRRGSGKKTSPLSLTLLSLSQQQLLVSSSDRETDVERREMSDQEWRLFCSTRRVCVWWAIQDIHHPGQERKRYRRERERETDRAIWSGFHPEQQNQERNLNKNEKQVETNPVEETD